jgi:hypothetical protein
VTNHVTPPQPQYEDLAPATPIPAIVYPTMLVSLQHTTGGVTNLKTTIRIERRTSPIQQYLTQKYTWDMTTFKNIDWAVHESALKIAQHQKIFNIKFIHFWLPVASHGAQQSTQTTCIRCNLETECQEHWYKCPLSRKYLHQQRQSSIILLNTLGLHYSLQGLILQTIFEQPWVPTAKQQVLCDQQTTICWSHFLRGRISHEWVTYQESGTHSSNGRSIMSKVIAHIFILFHDVWLHQSQQWHGNDPVIQDRHICQA